MVRSYEGVPILQPLVTDEPVIEFENDLFEFKSLGKSPIIQEESIEYTLN